MVDLDHFKTVNDLFGHASGDAVLREFSQRLLAVLRLSDVAIRWGGEEFLVILPDTDLAGARMIADRLIAAMRARPIELTNGQLRTVTVSIGAAQCNHANPETLLREVDDALYRAKGQGRDRLCVAPAEPADTHRNGGEESRDSARHDG
jgi:diguanylate cyclase (GGDEF)-like protein